MAVRVFPFVKLSMNLKFLFRGKLPVIFQSEAAECGIACLAMISGYHGKATDLPTLRRRFSVSLRGATLAHIIRFASALDLTGRPLRIEMEELCHLQTPCILHWDMDHFVVLKSASSRSIVIHDPALGRRRMSYAQASTHFTGVALELTPTPLFVAQDETRPLRIRDLTGRIVGLKRALAQVFVLALMLEFFALVSPLFLQLSIDKAIAPRDRHLLSLLGISFVLLVVLISLLGSLRSWATLYFGTELKLQWYAQLFSHLVRLPVSFFEKRYFGDITSRFEGADLIQHTLSNSFVETILDGLISSLVFGVMFFYSVRLALVVLAFFLLYVLLRSITYRPLWRSSEEYVVNLAKQQSYFIETLRGIRTIKTFGREDARKTRWMNLLADSTNAQVATEKLNILFKSSNTLIFGLQTIVVVWLGVILVIDRVFTIGMLFAFVAYLEQFKARMTMMVDRVFDLRMLSLQAQRLSDVVYEKAEPALAALPSTWPSRAGIEVKSVWFRYSDTEPWLLENIKLRIEAGECVAITGPSGAGKSTLLKLMAGLLHPAMGDVLIDGQSVRDNRAATLGKVGFVLQDDTLFAGTIADNIAFASDVPDMSRVQECGRLACLHDDIQAMPMGYSTLVGDMGSALSGGQQQRLLLARALYQQPSMLILDEATGNLDIPTEQKIAEMLSKLRITRVFAAHRPETIAIADRVISLGRAREMNAQSHAGRVGQTTSPGMNGSESLVAEAIPK
jgi:ATP-binding cassette, subfamily B, bacterial CvaB/MchF/RaxB